MAYATVPDLEAYWRTLTTEEETRADTLLDYAALFIDSKVTVTTALTIAAKFVSCDMVKVAMLAGTDSSPMTAFSQTGGPYQASVTFANPTGDLFWSSKYDTLLGLSGVGFACMKAMTSYDTTSDS